MTFKMNLLQKEFDSVISLGFFCGTAQEIEKIGLRSFSGPFDWLITLDFKSILGLIINHFEGLFEGLHFVDDSNEVDNDALGIQFYHDFKRASTIESQIPDVRKKYARRIDRFYEEINNRTLFIRYIYSIEEEKWIDDNYQEVLSLIKKFNPLNEIIFVSHFNNIEHNNFKPFLCSIDKNDVVCRYFIKKNATLLKALKNNNFFDKKKRKRNLRFYRKKQFNRIKNKFKHFLGIQNG